MKANLSAKTLAMGSILLWCLTPTGLPVGPLRSHRKASLPTLVRRLLWVVTPPYHFQNARYLDTGYGITAQEAVRDSPREFSFVLNCADYERESKWVELAIYPSDASQKEVDEALAKLGSSPLGQGRLWIEDSKITPGHKSGSMQDLGAIHWIKFRVEIQFPAAPPPHLKP